MASTVLNKRRLAGAANLIDISNDVEDACPEAARRLRSIARDTIEQVNDAWERLADIPPFEVHTSILAAVEQLKVKLSMGSSRYSAGLLKERFLFDAEEALANVISQFDRGELGPVLTPEQKGANLRKAARAHLARAAKPGREKTGKRRQVLPKSANLRKVWENPRGPRKPAR